ncbi:MAG: nucleotidyltransferase [Bacteroidota bacterium]|jgi:predicted nucleotidyltransferase
MDIFEEEITSFFQLLNKHSVKYILVGGFAVNYHGFSRATGDVDLWLEDSEVNRKKLVAALKENNVEGGEAFLTYPFIAGYSELLLGNGIYIDLMSDLQFLKQSNFDECYQYANNYQVLENLEVKVITVNRLIEEKEQSSRAKDKEDAEQLKKLYRK